MGEERTPLYLGIKILSLLKAPNGCELSLHLLRNGAVIIERADSKEKFNDIMNYLQEKQTR